MRDRDYTPATEFLESFFAGCEHAIEIRALVNGSGGAKPLFGGGDIAVKDHCRIWDKPGWGVFFGCCTRLRGRPTGSRADLAELVALWVDIDCYKNGFSKDDAVAALKASPIPPTVIIDSGGGIHAYWLLREPIDVRAPADSRDADTVKEEIDAALKQLSGVFAGDTNVCEIARVLRLPGTHNTKDGSLRLVALLDASGPRYELSDLQDTLDWLGPILRAPEAVRAPMARVDTDPFLEAAKRFGIKTPIDAEQRIAAMDLGGGGDRSIHQTQLHVSASLAAQGVDDDAITALLLEATQRAAGLVGARWNWKREERNIRAMIASARAKFPPKAAATEPGPKKSARSATVVQLRGGGAKPDSKTGAQEDEESEGADQAPKLNGFPLNDLGNAFRLITHHGGALRYVVNVGWHTWDGRRYEFDPAMVGARKLAHETVRTMLVQAFDIRAATKEKAKTREAIIKFAIASGNTAKITGMLSQAEPHLAADADALNRDPWLLNCLNGTLDLHTLELHPHAQGDLITKLVPVAHNALAVCPLWEKFLLEIFGGDTEMVDFVQRALGYSLTGLTTEQILFILHGGGSNGKSVLLEVIAAVLADYAEQCPSDTFVSQDKGSHIPSDIARLVGSRFVSIVETEQDRKLAEGLVKQATGGDRMVARFLHKEWFEFTPQFKLWMATNHKPRVRGSDNAIWRRLRLLPFLVRFANPGEPEYREGDLPKDRDLKNKLMSELPGILNWMIAGCLKWQKEGLLKAPKAVLEATGDYRESQDIAAAFVADACHQSPGLHVMVADLYKAYRKWCVDNGETPMSSHALGGALEEKGFSAKKASGGKRARNGLDLKEEWKRSLVFEEDQHG